MAQALYAKAALVDCERLVAAQKATDLVRAESCLQDAFVARRSLASACGGERGLPLDPGRALRETGQSTALRKSARPQAQPVLSSIRLTSASYKRAASKRLI